MGTQSRPVQIMVSLIKGKHRDVRFHRRRLVKRSLVLTGQLWNMDNILTFVEGATNQMARILCESDSLD